MSTSDALVLFGATGDLAYKKIFPALYRLARRGLLSMPVVGVSMPAVPAGQLIDRAYKSVAEHEERVDRKDFDLLASRLSYVAGDYRDIGTFEQLGSQLGVAERPLFYMAIPPSLFALVVRSLHKTGCTRGGRLVVEKPFAHDLTSAVELGRTILEVFPEESVFRIDHYLGKEPIENLSYFRFANSVFEPIWHRHYIRSMQITMAESFGVKSRGAFYDQTGAIRDVLQNHLLQFVATLAAGPPVRGESLRAQRTRLIRAIQPLRYEDVVRGQFRGYLDEPGVSAESKVETFCAVVLYIDSDRWAGVPFFIRAGKKLPMTATEARVMFRHPARAALGDAVPQGATYLRYQLNGAVTIALGLRTKRPGRDMIGQQGELVAHRDTKADILPYERLLGDALEGRNALFATQEGVEAEWRVVEGVIAEPPPLHVYEPGTWGPAEADGLIFGFGPWHAPATED